MGDQSQNSKTSPEDLFADWMKTAMSFWGGMNRWPANSASAGNDDKAEKKGNYRFAKSFESSQRILTALMAALAEPENVNASFKSLETLPQFMMNLGQQMMDNYLMVQQKMTERIQRTGENVNPYNFDDMDRDLFKKFREMYQTEIQKYFNVPSLGLNRLYQERYNHFLDKFNLYQTAINEFLYMFYIPMEKSFSVMQEQMETLAEKGEFHDDFKAYYNIWIKILEGHYMTLLKSPEYTEVMAQTIDSLAQYKQAKEDFLADLLQEFPVPTLKEMDALYKDIYVLKKRVNALSKKVEEKA